MRYETSYGMIFTIKNTKGKKVELYDAMDKQITIARSYNTATRMAEIVVPTGKTRRRTKHNPSGLLFAVVNDGISGKVATARVQLLGSYIIVNGKRY